MIDYQQLWNDLVRVLTQHIRLGHLTMPTQFVIDVMLDHESTAHLKEKINENPKP